jgi:hypothetical protein
MMGAAMAVRRRREEVQGKGKRDGTGLGGEDRDTYLPLTDMFSDHPRLDQHGSGKVWEVCGGRGWERYAPSRRANRSWSLDAGHDQ